jgi:hypothetical protein
VCTIFRDGGREYVLPLFASAGVWDLGNWVLFRKEDIGGARFDRSLDEVCVVLLQGDFVL